MQDGCHFLIATASPILMACPDADIDMIVDGPPYLIDYDQTHFLTRTEAMLRVLLGQSDEDV